MNHSVESKLPSSITSLKDTGVNCFSFSINIQVKQRHFLEFNSKYLQQDEDFHIEAVTTDNNSFRTHYTNLHIENLPFL